jgi:alginate O-acetyltransferase complex protein AlgI
MHLLTTVQRVATSLHLVLFNSLEFVGFFLVVTAGYFALPHRVRWGWLLVASMWFYAAFVPIYIFILAGLALVDYLAGIYLETATGTAKRYGWYASLVANLGVLAAFKYWGWLNALLMGGLHLAPASSESLPYADILLPLGLSFHTFQAISYTTDVYRGQQKAERHFGIFALYIFFYPQLVAGPIERASHMLHQFRELHSWDFDRAASGVQRMAWGLFKKVAVADRLGAVVHYAYYPGTDKYGGTVILATLAFAVQIYCDFSGYSDIALGAAEVMGFKLTQNFKNPLWATSMTDFWRRWHISLSSWFRDYVYIPLGGNRGSLPRRYYAVLVTFAASGLWHGADLRFVVWGLLHGLYLCLELITRNARQAIWQRIGCQPQHLLRRFLGWAATFSLVCLAWVFFRAASLADAWHLLRAVRHDVYRTLFYPKAYKMGQSTLDLTLLLMGLAVLLAVEVVQSRPHLQAKLAKHPAMMHGLGVALWAGIVLLGNFASQTSFIYFQF